MPKQHIVSFYCRDEDLLAHLIGAANRFGVYRSELIVALLVDGLDRIQQELLNDQATSQAQIQS